MLNSIGMYRMNWLWLSVFLSTSVFSQGYDFKVCDSFLKDNVDSFGRVKYDRFASDLKPVFISEIEKALKNNPKDFPENYPKKTDQFAYWINVYNHLVIREVVNHYPLKSIQDIPNVWKKKQKIGKQSFSLDEIEHDILSAEFKDPRFHFAIICAAYSCPKLQPFSFRGDKLEEQLELVKKTFFENTLNFLLDNHANTLYVSKIFEWYVNDFNIFGFKRDDFKTEEEFKKSVTLAYVMRYAPKKIADFVTVHQKDITLNVMLWHWTLNESVN